MLRAAANQLVSLKRSICKEVVLTYSDCSICRIPSHLQDALASFGSQRLSACDHSTSAVDDAPSAGMTDERWFCG